MGTISLFSCCFGKPLPSGELKHVQELESLDTHAIGKTACNTEPKPKSSGASGLPSRTLQQNQPNTEHTAAPACGADRASTSTSCNTSHSNLRQASGKFGENHNSRALSNVGTSCACNMETLSLQAAGMSVPIHVGWCEPQCLVSDVHELRWIGQGSQGVVFVGVWQGADVAVKWSVADQLDAGAYELLYSKLLGHPNVVQTYDAKVAILNTEMFDQDVDVSTSNDGDSSCHRIAAHHSTSISPGDDHLDQVHLLQLHAMHMAHEQLQRQDSYKSNDGFGNPYGSSAGFKDVRDMLHLIGAKPGQCITQMIMEYCDQGSLLTAISRGIFKPSTKFGPKLALRSLFRTGREVALGMWHLHAANIVHGDLKPANVLLMNSRKDRRGFVAKVSDFGLAQYCPAFSVVENAPWGTLVFMAPERFTSNQLVPASDVWSFGVLLWQMYTAELPYAGIKPAALLAGVANNSLSLTWPPGSPLGFKSLVADCMHRDPASRPTFQSLVARLTMLENEVRMEGCRLSNSVDLSNGVNGNARDSSTAQILHHRSTGLTSVGGSAGNAGSIPVPADAAPHQRDGNTAQAQLAPATAFANAALNGVPVIGMNGTNTSQASNRPSFTNAIAAEVVQAAGQPVPATGSLKLRLGAAAGPEGVAGNLKSRGLFSVVSAGFNAAGIGSFAGNLGVFEGVAAGGAAPRRAAWGSLLSGHSGPQLHTGTANALNIDRRGSLDERHGTAGSLQQHHQHQHQQSQHVSHQMHAPFLRQAALTAVKTATLLRKQHGSLPGNMHMHTGVPSYSGTGSNSSSSMGAAAAAAAAAVRRISAQYAQESASLRGTHVGLHSHASLGTASITDRRSSDLTQLNSSSSSRVASLLAQSKKVTSMHALAAFNLSAQKQSNTAGVSGHTTQQRALKSDAKVTYLEQNGLTNRYSYQSNSSSRAMSQQIEPVWDAGEDSGVTPNVGFGSNSSTMRSTFTDSTSTSTLPQGGFAPGSPARLNTTNTSSGTGGAFCRSLGSANACEYPCGAFTGSHIGTDTSACNSSLMANAAGVARHDDVRDRLLAHVQEHSKMAGRGAHSLPTDNDSSAAGQFAHACSDRAFMHDGQNAVNTAGVLSCDDSSNNSSRLQSNMDSPYRREVTSTLSDVDELTTCPSGSAFNTRFCTEDSSALNHAMSRDSTRVGLSDGGTSRGGTASSVNAALPVRNGGGHAAIKNGLASSAHARTCEKQHASAVLAAVGASAHVQL